MKTKSKTRGPKANRSDVLAKALREREREVIADYLKRNDGNVGSTAKALGITRRSLEMKMAAHALRDTASTLREKAGVSGPR